MLIRRQDTVLLEGIRNLLNYKSSPQFAKYLHKHNRSDVLNFLRESFGDRHEPLPFPGCREGLIGPHED